MKVISIYNFPHSSDIYIFDGGGGAKNIILLNNILFISFLIVFCHIIPYFYQKQITILYSDYTHFSL